jgi:hypothetical protein
VVRGKRGSGGIYAAPFDDRTESPETVPPLPLRDDGRIGDEYR